GSLDAIGMVQQAFLFTLISSYPLAIGRLLEARGRPYRARPAAGAMAGFAVVTTPWVNGVLLMVFFVGGMGLFIALAWALDQFPRLVLGTRLAHVREPAALTDVLPDAPRERDGARPHPLPATGHAGST